MGREFYIFYFGMTYGDTTEIPPFGNGENFWQPGRVEIRKILPTLLIYWYWCFKILKGQILPILQSLHLLILIQSQWMSMIYVEKSLYTITQIRGYLLISIDKDRCNPSILRAQNAGTHEPRRGVANELSRRGRGGARAIPGMAERFVAFDTIDLYLVGGLVAIFYFPIYWE